MSDTPTTGPDTMAMFGCTATAFEAFIASVDASITKQVAGPGMVVMSLLSDAQEHMAHGDLDEARQTINRAKYLISHYRLGLNAG
jgi:hypothetical protein